MKKLLLPIILLILGTGAGVGAGIVLKPEPSPEELAAAIECTDPLEAGSTAEISKPLAEQAPTEFAKLNNQFIVPVVVESRIAAMVVVSLSIEVPEGQKEPVFAAEPKLRDNLLRVMFDHANIGGFSGNFTSSSNMRILRQGLHRAAKEILGDTAIDVLILDIVRQDN